MNLDRLNQWLTLLTNVAVVIGLLLVAYEIRQNYESNQRDSLSLAMDIGEKITAASRDLRLTIASDPELTEIWHRGNLNTLDSEVDKLRYGHLTYIWLTNWYEYHDGWERYNEGEGELVVGFLREEVREAPGLLEVLRQDIHVNPEGLFAKRVAKWIEMSESL